MGAGLFSKIFVFVMLFSSYAKAEFSLFPNSSVSGYQLMFSGEKGKSLSEAGTGYGIVFENRSSGTILSFYAKARLGQAAGSQNFLDDGALVKSKFTFYQAGGDLGFYLYPLRRNKSGMNVFVGAGAIADYSYIYLDKETAFTHIPNSDQGVGYGYALTVGSELIFNVRGRPMSLNTQVNYRAEYIPLLKQSTFNLSGLQLNVGLGF